MELAEYDKQAELEDRFWWFVGMRAIYQRILSDVRTNSRSGGPTLDIGCGVGNVRRCLPETHRVIGVDYSPVALAYCRTRGYAGLVQADGEALPFQDERFGLIIALNILEHIDDDVGFLSELRRCCQPDGRIVLVTSACQALWSEHDEAVHHKRRYSRSLLLSQLSRAGLRAVRVTHANTFLFPPALLIRQCQRWRRRGGLDRSALTSDVRPLPPLLNSALTGLLRIESGLLRWGNLPFGISLVCVCERA